MRDSCMLEWTLGTVLMLIVAAMAITTAIDHRLQMVPPVERPYLGHLCINPATDADLERCFGLRWSIDLEAQHQLGVR